jgi:hypothetical protein
MQRRIGAAAVLAGVLALWAGPARGERTPGTKTTNAPNTGARLDLSVPYLTTGRSTLMPGAVAPRIYASPIVEDPKNPQAKPVFNLIFYGSAMSYGDQSNGATQRPANQLRPPKP